MNLEKESVEYKIYPRTSNKPIIQEKLARLKDFVKNNKNTLVVN